MTLAMNRLQRICGYRGGYLRRCCLQRTWTPTHSKDNDIPRALSRHLHCCYMFAFKRPEDLAPIRVKMVDTDGTDGTHGTYHPQTMHVGMLLRCFLCHETLPRPDWNTKGTYPEWKGPLVSGMSIPKIVIWLLADFVWKCFLSQRKMDLSDRSCAPAISRRSNYAIRTRCDFGQVKI